MLDEFKRLAQPWLSCPIVDCWENHVRHDDEVQARRRARRLLKKQIEKDPSEYGPLSGAV